MCQSYLCVSIDYMYCLCVSVDSYVNQDCMYCLCVSSIDYMYCICVSIAYMSVVLVHMSVLIELPASGEFVKCYFSSQLIDFTLPRFESS